jgi:hypothetical protein
LEGAPLWRILGRQQFRGKLRPFCLDHVAHLIAYRFNAGEPFYLGSTLSTGLSSLVVGNEDDLSPDTVRRHRHRASGEARS